MRALAAVGLVAILASCGADGMPLRPEPGEDVGDQAQPNEELQAEAEISGDADGGLASAADAAEADAAVDAEAEAEASVAPAA